MPKSSLTVNLVLNRQRPNKNGQMPVYLRLMYKGQRKNIQTGVYVSENQWDTKNQCVKTSYGSGFSEMNLRLNGMKQRYIAIRDSFIKRGIEYSVDDVVGGDSVRAGLSDSLSDVLESMIKHKGLSHNTAMAYRACVRRLSEAGVSALSDISPDGVQGLCKRMKQNELSDSSVNVTMACLGSLWKYGVDLGICEGYLFSRFRHWKKYRISEKKICLTEAEMQTIGKDFVSRCVNVEKMVSAKGEWGYTDEAEAALMNRNSELFAQACFLLCYYLQGMAFCDMVKIRSGNISLVSHNGDDYYYVTGVKRKKTNKDIVDMMILRDKYTCVLFDLFLDTMDKRGGYFLPVLQNNEMRYCYDSAKKVSEASGTCSVVVNRNLRSVFCRLGINEDATFYAARHTFATHFILNGGNPVYLADLMGRSVNGIFRYVNGLTSTDQHIRERTRVFGNGDRMLGAGYHGALVNKGVGGKKVSAKRRR